MVGKWLVLIYVPVMEPALCDRLLVRRTLNPISNTAGAPMSYLLTNYPLVSNYDSGSSNPTL